jgi:hypothetical protein
MHFPSGYVPLDPVDYMLSEKLLEGVDVDIFAGKNSYRWRKYAAQSARIASFCPLAITLGPGLHLGAFSSNEIGYYWRWGLRRSS